MGFESSGVISENHNKISPEKVAENALLRAHAKGKMETRSQIMDDLRKQIAELDEEIAHANAKIEELVSHMQSGKSSAGPESLKKLLAEELNAEKIEFMKRKEGMLDEKKELEAELGDL